MPAGKCANCDAAVPYLARACPYCGLLAALALLVLLGGASYFGAGAFLWAPQASPQTSKAEPQEDAYGWIVQAMADCDVYAKQYPDILYFLIVPLALTEKKVAGWNPVETGRIGGSATLISSRDAIIGLRNGMLVLYRKPITFAIKDTATQTIYKWKPAAGVSELKSSESGLASPILGFQLAEQADIEWGPAFSIAKGACYWIMPVIGAALGGG
jgi:hypothetical protein